MKKNLKILLFICIISIIFIAFYWIYQNNHNRISYIYSDKDIVYEIEDNNDKQLIPQINLMGDDVSFVNQEIISFLEYYYDDENVLINYDYTVDGAILSLLVYVCDYNQMTIPEILFKSYHIDLVHNTVLSDEELLRQASLTNSSLEAIVENGFIDYYNQSDIRKYCDYDCFMKDRNGYFIFSDDVHLFLKNHKLYAYLSIHPKMEFIEYSYFMENDFSLEVGDFYD